MQRLNARCERSFWKRSGWKPKRPVNGNSNGRRLNEGARNNLKKNVNASKKREEKTNRFRLSWPKKRRSDSMLKKNDEQSSPCEWNVNEPKSNESVWRSWNRNDSANSSWQELLSKKDLRPNWSASNDWKSRGRCSNR